MILCTVRTFEVVVSYRFAAVGELVDSTLSSNAAAEFSPSRRSADPLAPSCPGADDCIPAPVGTQMIAVLCARYLVTNIIT